MAIFHLSVKTISRTQGRSAVAASAYRAGVALSDARYGMDHDYTRKQGVASSFIVAPEGAEWAQDRAALWNGAEAAETRKNSTVAREYELALPEELTDAEREELARLFAQEVVDRYGVAADVAIHRPGREGDQRNHHAHILTTTRVVTADGLTEKTRVLDTAKTGSAEVEGLRALWADQVNTALEQHHRDAPGADQTEAPRVDHRSFKRRGIEREPTVHLGAIATEVERRAQRDDPDAEPVTLRASNNAGARERNRLRDLAEEAIDLATDALAQLGRKAHAVFGFARAFGDRLESARQEAEAAQLAEQEAAVIRATEQQEARERAERKRAWERHYAREQQETKAREQAAEQRRAEAAKQAKIEEARQARIRSASRDSGFSPGM